MWYLYDMMGVCTNCPMNSSVKGSTATTSNKHGEKSLRQCTHTHTDIFIQICYSIIFCSVLFCCMYNFYTLKMEHGLLDRRSYIVGWKKNRVKSGSFYSVQPEQRRVKKVSGWATAPNPNLRYRWNLLTMYLWDSNLSATISWLETCLALYKISTTCLKLFQSFHHPTNDFVLFIEYP